MNYLKLIRYQNLLMLALMQLIFRYGFLELQNIPLALADWQYCMLVLATVCIAAGGYIINNIFDVETDTENKPENVIVGKFISETKAIIGILLLQLLALRWAFIYRMLSRNLVLHPFL